MSKLIKTTNASLLIVGTSIGAGMLGLPVETGRGGFVLSFVFLVINWMIMTGTALMGCVEKMRREKCSFKLKANSFPVIRVYFFYAKTLTKSLKIMQDP